MGCLRRLVISATLAIQILTFALALLVIGSAGVLGKAAIISSNDALILFILSAISLVGTLVLAVLLWSGGRTRRRLAQELAAHQAARPTDVPTSPRQHIAT